MRQEDILAVAALQPLAFPAPFDEDLLWNVEHLTRHISLFPVGQWVADADGEIVASCSNTCISEDHWMAHDSWDATVGGPLLDTFNPNGTTLYGLDITVHPEYRRRGIGREFYKTRFQYVEQMGLRRYGTGCRLPDFQGSGIPDVDLYAAKVIAGELTDRTLTPLLRYGLSCLGVIENYMDDAESGNAAALLEWIPGSQR